MYMRAFRFSLISVILIITLTAAVSLSAGCTDVYLRGDSDADGFVTIVDATRIQRVLSGVEHDDDGSVAHRANVTGEELNILDANAIQRYLAGIDNPFGVGVLSDVYSPFTSGDNRLPIIRR